MSETELPSKEEKKVVRLGARMDLLPAELLREIDKNILEGYGAGEVLKTMVVRYRGTEELPSLSVVDRYVKTRRKEIFTNVDERARLEVYLAKKVDLLGVDVRNPREVMIAQMNFLLDRTEHLRKLNENLGDSRVEKIMSDNMGQITDILETQLKVDAYLGMDQQKLRAVTGILSKQIIDTLVKLYKDLHGEKKFEEFAKLMEAAISKLDYAALEGDVAKTIKEGGKTITQESGK